MLYHEVSDHPSRFMDAPSLNVPPILFARQMDYISDHFNIIGPDELLDGGYDRPAVLITFDDGMLGYFNNAVPIMTERQIPSINFLNMDTIEGSSSWAGLVAYLLETDATFRRLISNETNLPTDTTMLDPGVVRDYLSSVDSEMLTSKSQKFTGAIASKDDLETVQFNPLVFLGNHLANHNSTLTLSTETLTSQYCSNQTRLNHFPNSRPMFAYPHGRFRHGQNELLRSLGAQAIFYSSEGVNREGFAPIFNRLSVDSRMTRIEDLIGQVRWVEFRRSMNWDYRGHEAIGYAN